MDKDKKYEFVSQENNENENNKIHCLQNKINTEGL